MTFSILSTIRGLAAPDHRISCSSFVWGKGLLELKRRGEGCHECGAFLLGQIKSSRRRINRFVFYDDLDPQCLVDGYVNFNGKYYSDLWSICRQTGLVVVADVHTHPRIARQSLSDQQNPMIAQKGHVAILIPNFAQQEKWSDKLGVYEYQSNYRWKEYYGKAAARYLYLGIWG
jgi:proteasome lid subunit RPN8/RPN11